MKEDCPVNSGLKIFTCEPYKRREQCIGLLELKDEKNISSSSSSINGQRFVASSTHVPINNFKKLNPDELKTLPYFQNYHKGIPSKVGYGVYKYNL